MNRPLLGRKLIFGQIVHRHDVARVAVSRGAEARHLNGWLIKAESGRLLWLVGHAAERCAFRPIAAEWIAAGPWWFFSCCNPDYRSGRFECKHDWHTVDDVRDVPARMSVHRPEKVRHLPRGRRASLSAKAAIA